MLRNSPIYAYIPATDVARARQFYESKLGMVPARELAGGVFYAMGKETGCFLYPTPTRVPRRPARRSGRSRMWSARLRI